MLAKPARLNSKVMGVQKRHIAQFAVLWIVGMLIYMGMGFVSPQFSVRIIGQGFSLSDFGIIQGVATLLSISTQVYIGKLSDRIGKRKPMVVGAIILMIPVVILFPHVHSMGFFILLLAFNQMATSLFNATTANWVTRFGVQGQLGRLHGFYRISFSVGWVVATMFIGTLLNNLGLNRTFYVASIFLIIGLILVIVATRENGVNEAVGQDLENETESASLPGPYKMPTELKLILFALGVFICAQTMGMNLNYIFITDDMNVTNQQFGWLTSIQSWPEIPLMLLLGILSDKISNSVLLVVGMILAGLRWFLMSVVRNIGFLYLIQPLHAVGMTVSEVIIVAVIARLTPSKHLGAVMGWQVTVVNVARFLAPLLAGLIGQYFGIRTVFFISSLVAAAAGLIILRATRANSYKKMA